MGVGHRTGRAPAAALIGVAATTGGTHYLAAAAARGAWGTAVRRGTGAPLVPAEWEHDDVLTRSRGGWLTDGIAAGR